jgi:hypothetical protein
MDQQKQQKACTDSAPAHARCGVEASGEGGNGSFVEALKQPVAWMRDSGLPMEAEPAVISDRVKRLWCAANPKRVERYTIPLGVIPVMEAR